MPMDMKIKQGETLFHEGKIDEAERCFRSAVDNDPRNAEAYNDLAVIAIHRRDFKTAIDHLTTCLSIDPHYKDAVINYIEITKSLNQPHRARPVVEHFLRKFPDDREVMKVYAASDTVRSAKARVAVLCLPGWETFLGSIVDWLEERYDVRTYYTDMAEDMPPAVEWADIVWIEWAHELAVKLTNALPALEQKHVVCRLHSYEAYDGYIEQINWERIDDLIFVADHVKNYVQHEYPDSIARVKRAHVIPNGVNLVKFPFRERTKGKNLAYLGQINYKKGPMLLLHAFAELARRDPEYRLFIAGEIQNPRYAMYYSHMIEEMGLRENIRFDGWIEDVPAWLEDKHYLVSTSILEGHPVGIMEAMACGIKPVTHNFVGARGIYERRFLWNTIPEFVEMILSDEYDSRSYRAYIEDHYSVEKQFGLLSGVFRQIEQELPVRNTPACRRATRVVRAAPAIQPPGDRPRSQVIDFNQPLARNIEIVTNRKRFTIDFCRDKKVLHVGCVDAGMMAQRIRESGFLHYNISTVARELVGIDIDERGLQHLTDAGYHVHRVNIETDGARLSELSRDAEVIVIPEVVEHLNNVGQALQNLKNCRFAGDILISAPNSFSYRTFTMLSANVELVHPDHNYYFSATTLRTLLGKYGFEIKRLLMYYWPSNDQLGRQFTKLMRSCPYYGDGIIAIIRDKDC